MEEMCKALQGIEVDLEAGAPSTGAPSTGALIHFPRGTNCTQEEKHLLLDYDDDDDHYEDDDEEEGGGGALI